MGWESSGMVGFDLGPLLEGQMRTAKLKSAYNLAVIYLRRGEIFLSACLNLTFMKVT